MSSPPADRVAVGVWAGWDMRVHFIGEGMSRVLCMLIEGAAVSGRVVMRVCVRPVNEASARDALESLRATEGVDWTLHLITTADEAAGRVALVPDRAQRDEGAQPARRGGVARLLEVPDRRIGAGLFLAGLAATPLVMLRALLRPLWRFAWRSGLKLSVQAMRDPVGAAPEIALGIRRIPLPGMRRLADGLAAWAAHRRAEAHKPAAGDAFSASPRIGDESATAVPEPDWHVRDLDLAKVDGWLSIMANLIVPKSIPGRRAMMLPDAVMLDFCSAWDPAELAPGGAIRGWFGPMHRNAAACDAILTISAHVARRHCVELLGLPAEKMRVVPYASPDLLHALPFLGESRRRTPQSRASAADILRRHARLRRWDYLADFPIEHVRYIAVSTQERPSKNLPVLLEALRILIQERHEPIKLLMTTVIVDEPTAPRARLHRLIRRHGLALDALSVPRLPDAEHAAFFHAAAVTVHASLFEGGDTPLAFSESVSVGTPCLMGRGPHTEEMLEAFPDLESFVFDPYDAEGLASLIQQSIATREEMHAAQLGPYLRMLQRDWAQVAEECAAATTGIPLVPVRRLAAVDG